MATTRNASKSIQNLKWFSVASLLKIAYLLRVLVTLMPSHGYVHPDEFFQSTEPMAVLLVGWKGNLTWEWTGQHPLRCAFFPYLLGQTVFKPLKAFFGDYPPPAYLIMVLPRLLFTLISFLSDAALGAMHRSGRLPHLQYTQLLHATSHVVFVYLTRTLTNSIEYLLYGWLLVLMIGSFGAKSRSRSLSNLSAALLATICTFGFWARPTFAAYALYPVIYWCIAPYRSNQRFWINVQSIIGRVFRLTCFALPIAIFLILFDTYYYRPEVIQQIVRQTKNLASKCNSQLFI